MSDAPLPRPSQALADGSGAMFDTIARRYDLLNRIMSFGMDGRWRQQLIAALQLGAMPAGSQVLDVATGTGDVALAILARRPDLRLTGLDPSASMLSRAAVKRGAQGHPHHALTLCEGDAQAMPFADATFAAACISFGIRNVPDRARAMREMARVVQPGGTVAVLELGEPTQGVLAPLARFHVHRIVPLLGTMLVGGAAYAYLQRSITAFGAPEAFAQLMRESGLSNVSFRPLSFGALHLYVGTRP
jgi:demethylmenaquinone methyltransferase/2-methoxy-6-polyprenyl-1,4-benzoquinol methylase